MRIVTYADDCGPVLQGNTRTALQRLREILGTVKLTVNEERCADACRRQETNSAAASLWVRSQMAGNRSSPAAG